tara:strand:- start:194 stop:463 length:270 start_codon:yes stop_codon:yes gene_type:complete
MSKIKLAIGIGKAAYKGFKAIKKNVAKNKDVVDSKRFLAQTKKHSSTAINPLWTTAGKWSVKTSIKRAKKKEIKSLSVKLKNMWKQLKD